MVFFSAACDKFEMRGFFASYEDVNLRFNQSMKWNSDNPYKVIEVQGENYSLFVMSDSHVGTSKNLNKFFGMAIENQVAAAVMVGDLTTGHEKDYRILDQIIPDENSLLTFKIPGNHDLYFDGWKQFYKLFGSGTYFFTVKTPVAEDLFICLDTGGGTLGDLQLAWFKDLLISRRNNFRHCVVLTHCNILRDRNTTSTSPQLEEVYLLLEMFLIHRIDLVISGHDHKRSSSVFGNTTYITMDAILDGYRDAGYLTLTSTYGNLSYEFKKI